MRSPELFVEEHGPRTGGRLFSFYSLVFAWYVLAFSVASLIGLEPLYMQMPPFYASSNAASKVPGVTMLAATLVLVLFALFRRLAGVPISRPIKFAVLLGALVLLVALQLVAVAISQSVGFADFISDFRWHLILLVVVSIAVFVTIRFIRRIDWWDNDLSNKMAWRVIIALAIFCFVFAGSIAMLRGGAEGIADAYNRGPYEYVDDIGKGLTIMGLMRDYNTIHPMLSMHAKVHPPGPVVMLWIMSSILLSRDALVLSLGTMAVGTLALFPLFAWVREMINQRVALTCCAIYALMPSIVIFTATSADIMFLPLLMFTLLFFWRALHRGSILYAAAAGVMYALMSLSSFSMLTVGAFFGFIGLWRLKDPESRMNVVKTAVVMLASFLLLHSVVRLATGFDVIECFRLSHAQFQEDQINVDKTQPRYAGWTFKFFNPICWFFYAGIPVSILFIWRLLKPNADVKTLFLAFALTLLVISPLYLARGEGERSAMYVLPFIAVPAAHMIDQIGRTARSLQPLAMTLLFLAAQCWLIESYLYTYW
ncbi:MAG: glycosyltransferase family 39 protein [Candidatus Hydrogenedentes bacterium]|nr:glycosyltransferase family 39 protein [Candidatus Hydrogenedentota bacterium]